MTKYIYITEKTKKPRPVGIYEEKFQNLFHTPPHRDSFFFIYFFHFQYTFFESEKI